MHRNLIYHEYLCLCVIYHFPTLLDLQLPTRSHTSDQVEYHLLNMPECPDIQQHTHQIDRPVLPSSSRYYLP